MFSPPLIQDMAIVWVTLLNVCCFWGPKNSGPNPDHPFKKKKSPRPPGALSTVGPFFRTSNFCFSGGPVVRGGGGGPKIEECATLGFRVYGSGLRV